jgi:hypothetical protein
MLRRWWNVLPDETKTALAFMVGGLVLLYVLF